MMLRWALVLAWMGLIFGVSHSPGAAASETAGFFGSWNGLARLAAHVAEYAILAFLLHSALAPHGGSPARIAFVVIGLTALYAISDEVHQLYVPNRFGRWQDVAADSAGACVCEAILWLTSRRSRRVASAGTRPMDLGSGPS